MTVVAAVGLSFSARRSAIEGPLRIGLAAVLLGVTAGYLAMETARGTLVVWDFVPLHLCDFAIFVAAFALIARSARAAEVVYFWALSGTVLAMVMPAVSEAFPSARFLFYFGQHALVVIAASVLVFGAGLRPRPGAPLRMLIVTNAYAAFVAVVNLVADANFLFLCEKPSVPTLLDYLGPWPLYILVGEAVALGLFCVLNLPFWFARRAT